MGMDVRKESEAGPELLDFARRQLAASGITPEEIEAHGRYVPPTYWTHFEAEDIAWHLRAIHDFLRCLASPDSTGATPVVRWRTAHSEDKREIVVCTWDRRGLLAKVAGALATVGLNIEEARVFTRSDHIVVDIFQARGTGSDTPLEDSRLKKMVVLLEAALQPPPHIKFVTRLNDLDGSTAGALPARIIPTVSIDQRDADDTLMEVVLSDRLGMLHDLLCAFEETELDVVEAWATTGAQAHCKFWVRGKDKGKITDASLLERLKRRLTEIAL